MGRPSHLGRRREDRLWGLAGEADPLEHPRRRRGYMMFADGGFDDWSRDKLRHIGELLDVQWLDDATSRHVCAITLDPMPHRLNALVACLRFTSLAARDESSKSEVAGFPP